MALASPRNGHGTFEAAEVLVDGGRQGAARLVTTLRRHVRPEHRVVDVAAQVEREGLLQPADAAEGVGVRASASLLERGVLPDRGHVAWCLS